MTATDNMESLADVIETDLVSLGRRAAGMTTLSGDKTRELLLEFHTTISKSVEMAVQAVRDNDQRAAESVLMMKDNIRELSERLLSRKAQRLATEDQNYLELVRMEMSFVNQMRRIYTLAKRIAKVVLPPVLAQRD